MRINIWRNVFNQNKDSSRIDQRYNLEVHHCKIIQGLCRRPRAGSLCTLSICCLQLKFKTEGEKQHSFALHGDRRNRSSLRQTEGGLSCFCVMSWKTRGVLEQQAIPFPRKQTSKNKQFHPTKKEMGQWDERGGQTGVREEWRVWQRAPGEGLIWWTPRHSYESTLRHVWPACLAVRTYIFWSLHELCRHTISIS